MKAQNRRRRNGKGKARRSISRRWLLGIVAAAALLLVFAGGGTAFALNQENHDSFCASCHTQPESTFYQQSLDKSALTLASFHAQKDVRCIDCHSDGGAFGRLAGLTQGTQDLFLFYSGNYHNPAVTKNPLGDGSCTQCHGDVRTRQDFNNHFHVFLARWQAIDPNAAHCVDCHSAHSVAGATELKQMYLVSATAQAVCERCHATLGGQ